jgi:hypothetical protein
LVRENTQVAVMASKAEEYRRLARECLEAANSGQNEDGRNALLQMAQVWLRLAAEQAEDLGQATATPPGSAEEPRPVVQQQQQQQVQPKTDDHKG